MYIYLIEVYLIIISYFNLFMSDRNNFFLMREDKDINFLHYSILSSKILRIFRVENILGFNPLMWRLKVHFYIYSGYSRGNKGLKYSSIYKSLLIQHTLSLLYYLFFMHLSSIYLSLFYSLSILYILHFINSPI